MIKNLLQWRLFKGIAIAVIVAFLSGIPAQSGYAQTLPAPGQMVHASGHFMPPLMAGLRVDLKDPFKLYFVMSDGDRALAQDERQPEYQKLIKYFMASLSLPNRDMWVNLSPKEADRIIPDNFSMTEMGRDLLAQDYLLKQFTASLMDPQGQLGKGFWEQIYRTAYQKYGTTDIPVDTFNKVWITADKANIFQKDDTAFLVDSHLKVMLEQDFVSAAGNREMVQGIFADGEAQNSASSQFVTDIVRNVIVPVIEKEVNEGANFAPVRQAYQSMILATWFKKALKDSLLGQIYADQSKVQGIAINDPRMKERIYQQYLEAYKVGVFNYIKEEMDPATQELLPRKYFSGGIVAIGPDVTTIIDSPESARKGMDNYSSPLRVTAVDLRTDEVQFKKPAVVPAAPVVVKDQKKDENQSQLTEVESQLQAVNGKKEAASQAVTTAQAKVANLEESARKATARSVMGRVWRSVVNRTLLFAYLLSMVMSFPLVGCATGRATNVLPTAPVAVMAAVQGGTNSKILQEKELLGAKELALPHVVAVMQKTPGVAATRPAAADTTAVVIPVAQKVPASVPKASSLTPAQQELAREKQAITTELEQRAAKETADALAAAAAANPSNDWRAPYRTKSEADLNAALEKEKKFSAAFIKSKQAERNNTMNTQAKQADSPVFMLIQNNYYTHIGTLRSLPMGSAGWVANFGVAVPFGDDVESGLILSAGKVSPMGWLFIGDTALQEINGYMLDNNREQTWLIDGRRNIFAAVVNTATLDLKKVYAGEEHNKLESETTVRIGIIETLGSGAWVLNQIPLVKDALFNPAFPIGKILGNPNHAPPIVSTGWQYKYGIRELSFYKNAYKGTAGKTFIVVERALPRDPAKLKALGAMFRAGDLKDYQKLAEQGGGYMAGIIVDKNDPTKKEYAFITPRAPNDFNDNHMFVVSSNAKYQEMAAKEEMVYNNRDAQGRTIIAYTRDRFTGEILNFFYAGSIPIQNELERNDPSKPILEFTRQGAETGYWLHHKVGAQVSPVTAPNAEDMPIGMILNGKTATIYHQHDVDAFRRDMFRTDLMNVVFGENYQAPANDGWGYLFDPTTGKMTFVQDGQLPALTEKTYQWDYNTNHVGEIKFQSQPGYNNEPMVISEPGKVVGVDRFGYVGRRLYNEIDNTVFNVTALFGDKRPVPDMLAQGRYPKITQLPGDLSWFAQYAGQALKPFAGVEIKAKQQANLFTTLDGKVFFAGDAFKKVVAEGRAKAGVLYYFDGRMPSAVSRPADPFQPVLDKSFMSGAKALEQGVAGVSKGKDGNIVIRINGADIPMNPKAELKVEAGHVVGVYEASDSTLKQRAVVVDVLFAGGQEVENLATGNVEIYAKGVVTPEQEADLRANGIYPEKALVVLVAKGQTTMVPIDPAKPDGVKRTVILKDAPARELTLDYELAPTMDQFKKLNGVVIIKVADGKEKTQWVSLKALNDQEQMSRPQVEGPRTAPSSYKDTGNVSHGVTWSPIPAGADRKTWNWEDNVPAVVAQIDALKTLGVNSVRIYTPITSEVILNKLAEAGISVVVSIPYDDDRTITAPKFDIKTGTYQKFIKEHFGKYPKGSMIELGNEYNYFAKDYFNGDINVWYDALGVAARAIHAIDPQIIVSTAHGEVPTIDALKKLSDAGVDAIGLNVYRGVDPTPAIKKLLQLIRTTPGVNPNLRVYLSEFGFSSLNKETDQEDQKMQAANYEAALKNISLITDPNFTGFFGMEGTRDEAWKAKGGVHAEGHFGLMNEDGTPKLAFAVFQAALKNNPPVTRPSLEVERGRAAPITNGERIANGARVLILGPNGETIGEMTRLYGGKYEPWMTAEVPGKLASHYQIIYDRVAGDSRPAVVEYATLGEVQRDFDHLKGVARQITMVRQKAGAPAGKMEAVQRIYFSPQMTIDQVEIGIEVGKGKENLSKLMAPGITIATASLENSFVDLDGKHVTVVVRRGIAGVVEAVSAVETPQDPDAPVSDQEARAFGNLRGQFFASHFENGSPSRGEYIAGYLEGGERKIYNFDVRQGANGATEYVVDWGKVMGYAGESKTLNIAEQDRQALGLDGRTFMLAEKLGPGPGRTLQKVFIIDPLNNKEIGSINPVKYQNGPGQQYKAEIYTKDGKLKSYLLQSRVVNGKLNLSIKKTISTAENLAPIGIETLQERVGSLSGKLKESVEKIAKEVGIAPGDVRFVPSYKINEENGGDTFYRLAGVREGSTLPPEVDPLARVIVFHAGQDTQESLVMVNTEFDGAKPTAAYERTVLGQFNKVETVRSGISRADLEKELRLDTVVDFQKYKPRLSYRHFGNNEDDGFIEVRTSRLTKGLENENELSKDLISTVYYGGGNALPSKEIEINQKGMVRFMKNEHAPSLDQGRSPLIQSGEVAVWVPKEGSKQKGLVVRETQWREHDVKNKSFVYFSMYENDNGHIITNPDDVTFRYYYGRGEDGRGIEGLIAERFGVKGYVFYSLNNIPLRIDALPNILKGKNAADMPQSSFEVKTMSRDGLMFRFIKEVGYPGATKDRPYIHRLFVNGFPMGTMTDDGSVELSDFGKPYINTFRNTPVVGIMTKLGIKAPDFVVEVPGQPGRTIDVKKTMEEMLAAVPGPSVDVLDLNTPEVGKMIDKDHNPAPYRNWIRDYVLRPINLMLPLLGVALMSILSSFRFRRRTIRMNAPKLSAMKKMEGKKGKKKDTDLPDGLAEKWCVFIATNKAVVAKQYAGKDSSRAVAGNRLRTLLSSMPGFFTSDEVDSLVSLFNKGEVSFDEVPQNIASDIAPAPNFDLPWVTDPGVKYESDFPSLVALRYAFREGWVTESELIDLMAGVTGRTTNVLNRATQWDMLFGDVRDLLLNRAVKGEQPLEHTFPDPEVGMYRTLFVEKGYTDIQAYVQDPANGETVKQRIQSYCEDRIALPLISQIRSDVSRLGDSMQDFRKEQSETAILSEFYRFMMINPSIVPDARDRREELVDGVLKFSFDHSIFDRKFNPNIMLPDSEPATFREKVYFNLLFLPPSETQGISLGTDAAIAASTLLLSRRLIMQFNAIEANPEYQSDPAKMRAAKDRAVTQLHHHTRFWKSVSFTNNWGSIFGRPFSPGLYKRITEPGGKKPDIQPNLSLSEIMFDATSATFFGDRVDDAVRDGDTHVYDDMMKALQNNEDLLRKRLALAQGYLADDGFLKALASEEKDPLNKDFYLKQVADWKAEVEGLLTTTEPWTEEQRTLAMALAGESLYWELMRIKDVAADNKKVEAFVHGSYTAVMDPFMKATEQNRLEQNSYAYFVNELLKTWKGGSHMWIMRRIVPIVAMGPVSWLMSRTLGTMKFKAREFNETLKPEVLVAAMGKRGVNDPLEYLNQRVANSKLHEDTDMQSPDPVAVELRLKLSQDNINARQREKWNRELIEVNYPKVTPKSLKFYDEKGKRSYKLQTSLYNFYGIENKFARYAIVAARAILTPVALGLAWVSSTGLGVVILAVAWGLLPLLVSTYKYAAQKKFSIAEWAGGTAIVALFVELLFGKGIAVSLTAFGTLVTGTLLWWLIPVTLMVAYYGVLFVKSHRVYADKVWNAYWRVRTGGWQTVFLFRPIRNIPGLKTNFFGKFYGQMIFNLLQYQHSRGALLPLQRMIEEKLPHDFKYKLGRTGLLSPTEVASWTASVQFLAYYREGIKAGDLGWDVLVSNARAYEESLKVDGIGQKDWKGREYLSFSDEELVKLKRPFMLIEPKLIDAREYLFHILETISFVNPVISPFAVLPGVTSNVVSHNEEVNATLFKYGPVGTYNIAGAREFLPKLRRDFRRFLTSTGLKGKQIDEKEATLVAAYGVNDFPMTLDNIVARTKFAGAEKEWLETQFREAKANNKLAETSLLGYMLRKLPEARQNIFEMLLTLDDKEAFQAFKEVMDKMQDTDDVVVAFRDWAKGRPANVVTAAEDALAAFMNEFLPNNISMLRDVAEDVFNMHLFAALEYNDHEYYRLALEMFERYGSLKLASESLSDDRPDNVIFKRKFKFYQKSAKLKTSGIMQYGMIWGGPNKFCTVRGLEKPEDFPEDISGYTYVARSFEKLMAFKTDNADDQAIVDRLRVNYRAVLDAQPGVKVIATTDGKREVLFSREMRDVSKAFFEFRKNNINDILALSNGPAAGLFLDIYQMMLYVEESARAEAIVSMVDARQDNQVSQFKSPNIARFMYSFLGLAWLMDAGVRVYTGHSFTRLFFASEVGRNPEQVIVNPALIIASSNNNAFPIVRIYALGQHIFSRVMAFIPSCFGKIGANPLVAVREKSTPVEDSASLDGALARYPWLVATQSWSMKWVWPRPAMLIESIFGTETSRYIANVTELLMAVAAFSLNVNPKVGVDVKRGNFNLYNHYQLSEIANKLMRYLPGFQGFSGFAFLVPVAMFIPIAVLSMQSINFLNYLFQWRIWGNFWVGAVAGIVGTIEKFPYAASMPTFFMRTLHSTSNQVFKFLPTVKTMIQGFMDSETRSKSTTDASWVASINEPRIKAFKIAGAIGVAAGLGLGALSFLGLISANIVWVGPVIGVIGLFSALRGFILDYSYETEVDGQGNGKITGPIPIPFESVILFTTVASWVAGFFFAKTYGPAVTFLYLLTGIGGLTGGEVHNAYTKEVTDADGNKRLQVDGMNLWAMFTKDPRAIALKIFLAGTLGVAAAIFLPMMLPASLVIPALTSVWLIRFFAGVMALAALGGAFSAVTEKFVFLCRSLMATAKRIFAEIKRRPAYKASLAGRGTTGGTGAGRTSTTVAASAAAALALASGVPAPVADQNAPASDQNPIVNNQNASVVDQKAAEEKAQAEKAAAEQAILEARQQAEQAALELTAQEQAQADLKAQEERLKNEIASADSQPVVETPAPAVADEEVGSTEPESVITQPVSTAVVDDKIRAEEQRINDLIRKQNDRVSRLMTYKQQLEQSRSTIAGASEEVKKEWRNAYRKVSTQIGIIEKKTLPRLQAILGDDPIQGKKDLEASIVELKKPIKALQGEAKEAARQALAEKRKELSFVMRSAKAATLKEVGSVIEAAVAIPLDQVSKLNDPDVVEALVKSNEGAGESIRFFAGLTRAQKIAALKAAIAQLKVEKAIVVAQSVVMEQGPSSVLEKLNATLEAVKNTPVGGIDFNSDNLVINIQVDGSGMPLPAQFQDPRMVNIQGLTPVIRSIRPVGAANVPVFFDLMQRKGI